MLIKAANIKDDNKEGEDMVGVGKDAMVAVGRGERGSTGVWRGWCGGSEREERGDAQHMRV